MVPMPDDTSERLLGRHEIVQQPRKVDAQRRRQTDEQHLRADDDRTLRNESKHQATA